MKAFNIIKKITLCTFIILLVCLLSVRVKAYTFETTDAITVSGASIRTTGNQGLRFACKCDYKPSGEKTIAKYCAHIAFGSKDDDGYLLTSGTIFNTVLFSGTINDHSILDAYVTECDDDGYYYVTMTDIPSGYYLQDITIAPYVILSDGSKVLSSNALTRNIGEIALAYLNDGGTESTLITTVKNELDDSYRVNYTDNIGNYYITSCLYETNPNNIYNIFARDWNNENKTIELPTSTSEENFLTTCSGKLSCEDYSNSSFIEFLTKNYDKYGWILEFLKDNVYSDDTDYCAIVNYIKDSENNTLNNTIWNNGSKFIYCLFGFLSQSNVKNYGGIDYSTNYELYKAFNCFAVKTQKLYSNLLFGDGNSNFSEAVKINDNVTIPSLENGLWDCNIYYASEDDYEDYSVLSESKFTVSTKYYTFIKRTYTGEAVRINNINNNSQVSSNITYYGSINHCDGYSGTLDIKNIATNITFDNIKFDCCQMVLCPQELSDTSCSISNLTFKNCEIIVDKDSYFINWTNTDDCYVENIVFENCTFKSKDSSTTDNYANGYVYITNNDGMTIDNCYFENVKEAAIRINKTTNGCGENGEFLVKNSTFTDCLGNCVVFEYFDVANDARLYVYNNRFNFTDYTAKEVCFKLMDASNYNTGDYSRVIFDGNTSSIKIAFGSHLARHYSIYDIKCTYNGYTYQEIDTMGIVAD